MASSIKTIENLLFEWKGYCKFNSEVHNDSRGHFKFLNYGLMIPAMILGSATGIGTISIASNKDNADCKNGGVDWILLAVGCVGIVSTCLISVHRYMNVSQLQTEHDMYSDMFIILTNEIDMQLTLDDANESKMFTNKMEFMKYCKYRMDVLMDKAPPIPKKIISRKLSRMDPTNNASSPFPEDCAQALAV
jgi:hypothetical protein